MASEFPLLSGNLPPFIREPGLVGVLSMGEVERSIKRLRRLNVDKYIRETVLPSENPKRLSAPEVIHKLGGSIVHEVSEGPLYLAEINFTYEGRTRRVVMLAQNRKSKNGVWMPRHHRRATELMRYYSEYSTPIVTFMDTPGADAGEEANRQNQAHSISDLITEMSSMPTPTVGVVFGMGYSGGAIPLATTNILLSVRDGVFNTIHPQGLSDIAYNYNLSWQECAKFIGVSSFELCKAGYLDAVVDYSPLESASPRPLLDAIFSAISEIEKNAKEFLTDTRNDYFFDHYKDNITNYLRPTDLLVEENRVVRKTPTGRLNVFGAVYRFHRYLKLRRRLTSQSTSRYSRLVASELPSGELQDRLERDRQGRLERWINEPLEIRYDEELTKRYKRMTENQKALGQERGRLATFFIGTPEENYRKSTAELAVELGLYMYNFWKIDARGNLEQLLGLLEEYKPFKGLPDVEHATVLDALRHEAIRDVFPEVVQNLVLFDLLYDRLVENLPTIAMELKNTNQITRATMENLLNTAFRQASSSLPSMGKKSGRVDEYPEFFDWLEKITSRKDSEKLIRQVSDWKRLAFPRLSEPLFGILTYFYTKLLPSYYEAARGEEEFDGKINPRNIGIKDFWNRLNRAYQDLLIQNQLNSVKRNNPLPPKRIIDAFFTNFTELNADLMTSDPVRFPGFRHSIERALESNIPPSGVVTGLADFKHGQTVNKVGLVVSNSQFQAGAFDMAAGEKVCKLMVECAHKKLPVVMFISSGGMQTKEGAGALFSMAVLNNRITRFVKDFDLPVVCFGYRDCTGGAQASFVTHRLTRTYYLSGSVIPFAGQRVVPSHLPTDAILANYLSRVEGSMDGLVANPFDEEIDEQIRRIDPDIPIPSETVPDVLGRVLQGEYRPSQSEMTEGETVPMGLITFGAIKTMLVHARGCTAIRLISAAHDAGIKVVLVQSDADMESRAARMLTGKDRLVCLGGNTPSDSYLNGLSVIRIADQEQVDAIHPGIGFLSESPNFATLCRRHGLNFIGPRSFSMERMGNKSNAIATARKLEVGVVPGSQGVVDSPDRAAQIAAEIGYPVLIKAAFGGGGKGMSVVYDPDEFRETFVKTSAEAQGAFGNGDVYLEKFVESMRHVEVQ
ncbi:MAG: acetyl-CoA carboxylase, partial [Deltaproteobacteria bacterium]|nr:acetyl-CoA carboxylase [Deltaproteobacteria bacterium]